MSLTLSGKNLTIEKVVGVARHGDKIELSEDGLARIDKCRAMLERKIAAGEIMYGTNTGIGELSEIILPPDQVSKFQEYLIYNHAAGIGEPAPIEHVRAAMLSRVNLHCIGHSGCRRQIPLTYVAMLNAGITPVMCQKGSVGACGDLAPMAQVALSLMGEATGHTPRQLTCACKQQVDLAIFPAALRCRFYLTQRARSQRSQT
jgi:histidine ammonia-lyase